MNFDQFATSFKNPEPTVACGEIKLETGEPADVIIAGSMLAVTDSYCCIDINGVQYEVAPGDVIDIEVIAPPKPAETAAPEGAEAAPTEETGGKAKGKRTEEKKDVDTHEGGDVFTGPQTVLLRINKSAVLWRKMPVPAGLLAVMGTWMEVVPAEAA